MQAADRNIGNMFSNNAKIDEIIEGIHQRLKLPLPGHESQLRLAPQQKIAELQIPPPEDAIVSSVLMLLYPSVDTLKTIVILRSEYDGIHSGQISLPGGRMELTDRSHEETALREAHEEIGINTNKIRIIGSLSKLYINRSNYIVFPFIGFCPEVPSFKPDPIEVQEIIEFEVNDLLNPQALTQKTIYFKNGFSLTAPGYKLSEHFIWGATAMIFSEFLEILKSLNYPGN